MGWRAMDGSARVGDGMRRVQMFLPVMARHYPAGPMPSAVAGSSLPPDRSPPPSSARTSRQPAPALAGAACRRAIDQGRKSGAVTTVTGAPNGQATAFVSLNEEVDAV